MAKKSGIKIVKSKKKGEVFVHAVSANGNILVSSETLKKRSNAFKNILAAGKLYLDVVCGRATVTDENGVLWIYDINLEKFVKVF